MSQRNKVQDGTDHKVMAWSDYPAFDVELKRLAEDTSNSFKDIAVLMNAKFGNLHRFTRNSVLGRCSRMNYGEGLRTARGNGGGRPAARIKREPNGRKVRVKGNAPVIFKPTSPHVGGLRDDNGPRLPSPKRTRATKEQIEARRMGFVSSIVEAAPLTSVSLWECPDGGCKWPTCDDPTAPMVCGSPAVVGAYCERHGRIAYREMPTVSRNAQYVRRGHLMLTHEKDDADAA